MGRPDHMPASPSDTRAKPVIGILGGIGSGKSTVAGLFAALGCGVVDSDRLAREALSEPEVVRAIRERFGDAVVDVGGAIDRRALAERTFGRPDELAALEGIVHPRVHAGRARLRAAYRADPAVVAIVEDTPLLLEKGLDADCDVLVFVEAPDAERLRRVRGSRGWTPGELSRRQSMQLPLDIKRRRADHVIQNDDNPEACLGQVRRILDHILHDRIPPSS